MKVMGIKTSGAGKGKIDRISIKKIAIGVLGFLAGFYLINQDAVNELIKQYISKPEILAVVIPMILYITEEVRKDYTKPDLQSKKF